MRNATSPIRISPCPFFEEMKIEGFKLYIHIPFCVKKCAYCDFLSGPADADTIEKYVQALIREIESVKIGTEKIQSGHCFCGWRNAVLF